MLFLIFLIWLPEADRRKHFQCNLNFAEKLIKLEFFWSNCGWSCMCDCAWWISKYLPFPHRLATSATWLFHSADFYAGHLESCQVNGKKCSTPTAIFVCYFFYLFPNQRLYKSTIWCTFETKKRCNTQCVWLSIKSLLSELEIFLVKPDLLKRQLARRRLLWWNVTSKQISPLWRTKSW